MATKLHNQALTERQRTYRKITGGAPERPITHWLRAAIICLLCTFVGFSAGRCTGHDGHDDSDDTYPEAQDGSVAADTPDETLTDSPEETEDLLSPLTGNRTKPRTENDIAGRRTDNTRHSTTRPDASRSSRNETTVQSSPKPKRRPLFGE